MMNKKKVFSSQKKENHMESGVTISINHQEIAQQLEMAQQRNWQPFEPPMEPIPVSANQAETLKQFDEYLKRAREEIRNNREEYEQEFNKFDGAKDKLVGIFIDTVLDKMPGNSALPKPLANLLKKEVGDELKKVSSEALKFQRVPNLDRTFLADHNSPSANDAKDNNEIKQVNNQDELRNVLKKLVPSENAIENFIKKALDKHHYDANEILTNTRAIINLLENEKEKRQEVEEENANTRRLENYNKFISFIAELGAVTKCQPLKTAAQFANGVITINEGARQLQKILTGKGSTFDMVLGSIGTLGGGIVAIVKLFSDIPDPNTIIMNKLDYLSKQVNHLHNSLDSYFKQNFKNQAMLFDTITDGLNQLNNSLSSRIQKAHVELHQQLVTVQSDINLLTEQVNQLGENLLTFPLEDLYAATNNLLLNPNGTSLAKSVKNLTTKLANWATHHALHSQLTGINFWQLLKEKAPLEKSRLIDKYLQADNDRFLNSFLGFLIHEAKLPPSSKNSYDLEAICNPYIFYTAIENYTTLKTFFEVLGDDIKNYELDFIIKLAKANLKNLEEIRYDSALWKYLFDSYYQSVQLVHTALLAYAENYSNEIKQQRNTIYVANEARKNLRREEQQAALEQLNFLESNPESDARFFLERSVNNISDLNLLSVNTGFCDQHLYGYEHGRPLNALSELNKEPLYRDLKVPHLPTSLLLLEYLGDITFSVKQQQDVQHLSWDGWIPYPAQYHSGGNVSPDGVWTYPASEIRDAHIGAEILLHPNWLLPMRCQFRKNLTEQTTEEILNLNYEGNWNGLQPCPDIIIYTPHNDELDHNRRRHTVRDGRHYVHYCFQEPPQEQIYGNNLIGFIENYWNEPGQRTLSCTVERLFNEEQENAFNRLAKEHYLKQRKKIATNLSGRSDHELIIAFNSALSHLNANVKLVKSFAKLLGIDIENTVLKDLLTAEKIKEELKNFINSNDINLQAKLSPTLWNLIDIISQSNNEAQSNEQEQNMEINAQPALLQHTHILAMPILTGDKLSALHPQRLLKAALLELEFFKYKKLAMQEKYPEITHYTCIEEYMLKQEITRTQFLADETYFIYKELKAESFNKAKFTLKKSLEYFGTLTPENYHKIYLQICRWGLQQSQDPMVNGNYQFENDDPNNTIEINAN